MASPALAPNRPRQIPMDQAFVEAAAHVRNGLESLGIRWTPEAEQDAVSTLMIQAGKCGWLLPWNSPPAQPKNATIPASQVRQDAAADDLGPILAESIRQARISRNSGPQPVPPARSEDAPAPGSGPSIEHFEATEDTWR